MTTNGNSENTFKTDVLIIGGGPAGIQASRLIREKRPDLEVTMLRPEPHSMVYCALPYAIEGLFPLDRTFKSDELVTGVGVRLLRDRATGLDAAKHEVSLEGGGEISYSKLLIATGAIPARPPLPGADLDNVFTVKTAADAERIIKRLPLMDDCGEGASDETLTGVRAVVIGSGAIGIEQATAYRARGIETHLVEMQDHVLPHLLDPDMTGALEDELRQLGVRLHLSSRLEALEGDDEVNLVRFAGGKSIELTPGRDFVVLAIGMVPDIEVFSSAGLETTRDGLIVDDHMRTSHPDIWAAGDCVSFHSGIDGKLLGGKLATNAVPMAKVAARDMLGIQGSYPGFFNGAATVVGSIRAGGTGFTETFARSRGLEVFSTRGATKTRFPMMPDAGSIAVKLIFEVDGGRLVGAQAVGDNAVTERIDLCTFAMQSGAGASDLADLSYSAQPWQTFFPARNAIVEAATIARDTLESSPSRPRGGVPQ